MPDYRQLWEEKTGEAPKESVIAGLQKLLNQKQDQIIEMDAKIQALKQRILEYNDVLEEMEQEFRKQQERIKELEAQLGEGGGISGGTAYAESSADRDLIKRLQNKINELQNKLFIYSNLPSRITDLEAKLNEKNEIIDKYAEKVEELRNMLNQLSIDKDASKIIAELERKIEQQNQIIIRLKKQEGASAGLPGDYNNLVRELNQLKIENEELRKQLQQSQDALNSLQQKYGTGSLAGAGDILGENARLKREIENLKQKLREKDIKLEEIIERVQKKGIGAGASTSTGAEGKDEIISRLEAKIEVLQAENKALKEKVGISTPKPSLSGGPSKPILRPTAPKIREIGGPKAIPQGDAGELKELKEKVKSLQKDLSVKDLEIKKLNDELIRTQTELAKLKAMGPVDESQGNMMELLQDLQKKIRKLKISIKEKDELIAKLQGKQ